MTFITRKVNLAGWPQGQGLSPKAEFEDVIG